MVQALATRDHLDKRLAELEAETIKSELIIRRAPFQCFQVDYLTTRQIHRCPGEAFRWYILLQKQCQERSLAMCNSCCMAGEISGTGLCVTLVWHAPVSLRSIPAFRAW